MLFLRKHFTGSILPNIVCTPALGFTKCAHLTTLSGKWLQEVDSSRASGGFIRHITRVKFTSVF
jgi:hypothetical protein